MPLVSEHPALACVIDQCPCQRGERRPEVGDKLHDGALLADPRPGARTTQSRHQPSARESAVTDRRPGQSEPPASWLALAAPTLPQAFAEAPWSGRCGSNLRRSAWSQNVSHALERTKACKCRGSLRKPSSVAHVESGLSPDRRRRSSRLQTQKRPASPGLFIKRLMGFEPTTFCMASSSWDWVHALNVPANGLLLRARGGAADARLLPRNHGSFRTETGLTLIRPATVSCDLSR